MNSSGGGGGGGGNEPSSFFTINTMSEIDSYISIQGSIGAGKSTLVKSIKRYLDKTPSFLDTKTGITHYFILVDEPLDNWTMKIYSIATKNGDQSKKYSLLQLFYQDMKKNGFLFQIGAFTSRLKKIIDTLNEVLTTTTNVARDKGENVKFHIIAERSLRTDCLFFKNLYDTNVVSQAEWTLYHDFFTVICSHVMKKENLMVYVETDPEKCHKRIDKRDRVEEKGGNDNDNDDDDDDSGGPIVGNTFDMMTSLLNSTDVKIFLPLITMTIGGIYGGFIGGVLGIVAGIKLHDVVCGCESDDDRDSVSKKGGIPLDYLKSLKTAHDEMILEFEKGEDKRVIRQDFNDDMNNEEIDQITSDLMQKLISHVQGTQ
jgi:deoxyadenosine/deoxycytidine kinase